MQMGNQIDITLDLAIIIKYVEVQRNIYKKNKYF